MIITTMVAGLFFCYRPANAATLVDLATFSFGKADGPSTAKDLNDTYNTNADTGYSPKSGKFTTSKLFASLRSPEEKAFKKLEWTGKSSYLYNGKMYIMPVMESSQNNPWGKNPYFYVRTSSKGYEKIRFSFLLGGSKKGPKSFKVQYSTDGKTYKDVSGSSIDLATNKKMFSYSYDLPDAVSNATTLHLRIISTSTTTIEGGSYATVTTSGESAINNVSIKGMAIQAATKPTPTAAPKATTAPSSSNSNSGSSGSSTSKTTTTLKTLSTPTLSSYAAGSKTIKGKALKKAKVTVKVGKKTYTATASKKGSFKVKLSKKLKKGNKIKVYATKAGYKQSKTKKYTVK